MYCVHILLLSVSADQAMHYDAHAKNLGGLVTVIPGKSGTRHAALPRLSANRGYNRGEE